MSAIDGLPPLREVIARHDLRAKKQLGQNFLLDLNLTARIARAAGDLTQCDVIEVGPGPGGLTVINGDALEIDPLAHVTPPVRIAANLPYNIGTELLVGWLTPPEWPPFWQSLTLMFQKEVAQRIVAKPGGKDYGRLALLAQWRCEARIVLTLPPQAFVPAPKVESAVVHLTALPEPRFPADPRLLEEITRAAFNQRRKMLRASLRGLHPQIETLLAEAGIPPTARAEEIDLERFSALARALKLARGNARDAVS